MGAPDAVGVGANCAGAPAGGLNSFYISYSTKMPALRVLNSAKLIRVEATAFNDAFQGADGDGFAAVQGDYHLTAIFVPPFLMTASLSVHHIIMLTQNLNHFVRATKLETGDSRNGEFHCFRPFMQLDGSGFKP